MYYVILGVIALILFLLRKRIMGGIVGVISLFLVIALTIFLLDFFWLGKTFKGDDRDIRNFEPTQQVVKEYDEIVKDPAKKSQEVGDTIKDKGTKVNETLETIGSELDEKLGVQKDDKNNNLWVSSKGDEQSEHELEEQSDDKSENTNKDSAEEDNSGETNQQNTNSKYSKLTFDQLNRAESAWNLGKEDAKFVKSASPFNLGEFSNGTITIEVVEDGVLLK